MISESKEITWLLGVLWMRTLTIILLVCCLLGFAALVFVGNQLMTNTALEIARLDGEINRLKRQLADLTSAGPVATDTVSAPVPVLASADSGLVRAKETGRLYNGNFRIRSCPDGYLNVESDRVEGISVWCMKKGQ